MPTCEAWIALKMHIWVGLTEFFVEQAQGSVESKALANATARVMAKAKVNAQGDLRDHDIEVMVTLNSCRKQVIVPVVLRKGQ